MTSEIPKMQKAMVFEKHRGPIELRDIPVPTPGPDQILVNVKYTGGLEALHFLENKKKWDCG